MVGRALTRVPTPPGSNPCPALPVMSSVNLGNSISALSLVFSSVKCPTQQHVWYELVDN